MSQEVSGDMLNRGWWREAAACQPQCPRKCMRTQMASQNAHHIDAQQEMICRCSHHMSCIMLSINIHQWCSQSFLGLGLPVHINAYYTYTINKYIYTHDYELDVYIHVITCSCIDCMNLYRWLRDSWVVFLAKINTWHSPVALQQTSLMWSVHTQNLRCGNA